ncbi:MAG: UTP--glucose-1-phosphate uridylyltransferase GalU [Gammaproteobacteria bacterium]|nr:UTP--glucose-1-phosphate uridylyltransferase GalU [Gammaproteobacteria bacterium]
MHSKITKAVFPVAGLGTRFLPATKASPKEMLPIVDKPLIQYAAEEAVAAGIETLIFVTGRNKNSIPDHFDKAYELEAELTAQGKSQMLEVVQRVLPQGAHCVYIRQPQALGLGHAVLCAARVVGDEPFAVLLADDLIDGGKRPALQQMMSVYETHGSSVLCVEEVPGAQVDRYGIVEAVATDDARVSRVNKIVEKPSLDKAPSNLAVVGRYLLSPEIFTILTRTGQGAGGEIQLTDAIAALLSQQTVMAYRFNGTRYDCGSKLGYLQATVDYGLQHPELRDEFHAYLQALQLD